MWTSGGTSQALVDPGQANEGGQPPQLVIKRPVFFCFDDGADDINHPNKVMVSLPTPTVRDFTSLTKNIFRITNVLTFSFRVSTADNTVTLQAFPEDSFQPIPVDNRENVIVVTKRDAQQEIEPVADIRQFLTREKFDNETIDKLIRQGVTLENMRHLTDRSLKDDFRIDFWGKRFAVLEAIKRFYEGIGIPLTPSVVPINPSGGSQKRLREDTTVELTPSSGLAPTSSEASPTSREDVNPPPSPRPVTESLPAEPEGVPEPEPPELGTSPQEEEQPQSSIGSEWLGQEAASPPDRTATNSGDEQQIDKPETWKKSRQKKLKSKYRDLDMLEFCDVSLPVNYGSTIYCGSISPGQPMTVAPLCGTIVCDKDKKLVEYSIDGDLRRESVSKFYKDVTGEPLQGKGSSWSNIFVKDALSGRVTSLAGLRAQVDGTSHGEVGYASQLQGNFGEFQSSSNHRSGDASGAARWLIAAELRHREESKELKPEEVERQAGELWKKMNPEQRKLYLEMQEQELKGRQRDSMEWEAAGISGSPQLSSTVFGSPFLASDPSHSDLAVIDPALSAPPASDDDLPQYQQHSTARASSAPLQPTLPHLQELNVGGPEGPLTHILVSEENDASTQPRWSS